MEISEKEWILLNAIKGDVTAYLPGGKKGTPFWFARASGTVVKESDHAELVHAEYMQFILPQNTGDEMVLTAEMTAKGIAAWESVPGGIGPITGKCDGCGNVTEIRPFYDGECLRFIYECSDCDVKRRRNRARALAQGV